MQVLWLTLVVFILDQITKWAIHLNFDLYQSTPVIENFFYLTYVTNEGMAFGLSLPGGPFILLILSVIMTFILIFLFWQERSSHIVMRVSLALILAGAIGNFTDRIILGKVIDFLHFKVSSFWEWYIFNIADSAVTIGMLLFVYYSIFIENKVKLESQSN